MQRMINVEAKAGLKSNIMIQDVDFCYSRHYRLSQNTCAKMQTQDLIAKESILEKSRPKKAKPTNDKSFALSRSNKAIKLNCQAKKKEY